MPTNDERLAQLEALRAEPQPGDAERRNLVDRYEAEFNRAVGKRLPRFALEIENR